MTTTITVSEALKNALEDIRDIHEELSSLDATIHYVIENPGEYAVVLQGEEETLTEPVKVKRHTQERVNGLKKIGDYDDYDAVIRAKIGAAERETAGERPIEVRDLGDA